MGIIAAGTLTAVADGSADIIGVTELYAVLLILGAVVAVAFIARSIKGPTKTAISAQRPQGETTQDVERILSLALGTSNLTYDARDVPLNLATGERPLIVLPYTDLVEVATKGTRRSTWGGPSIRVAKGVSYRFGSSKSTYDSQPELRNVDEGTLVVTSERLAFIGAIRTISAKWRKVLSVTPFTDAVGVHLDGRSKPVYFRPSGAAILTFTVDGVQHDLRGDAYLLRAAIDVARQRPCAAG